VALDSSLLVHSLKLNFSVLPVLYFTSADVLPNLVTTPSSLAYPINFLPTLYGNTASYPVLTGKAFGLSIGTICEFWMFV